MSKNINDQTNPLKNTNNQVSLEKSQRAQQTYNTLKTTEATQENIAEEERRANTYDGLMSSATQAQQKYESAIKMYNTRVSGQTPYSNKNIKLSDGSVGYVNNLGYFQKYDSIDNTAGLNNCPNKSNITDTDLSPIDIGNPLSPNPAADSKKANTTCGYEGKNVYVSGMLPGNMESKSEGCYKNTGSLSVYKLNSSDNDSSMTYEDCKYMAAQLGKPVFGLQNFNKNNGFSTCLVGDNYASATSGGKRNITIVSKSIWNSNSHWLHAKENPDDIITWDPIYIGCCEGQTMTTSLPDSNVVVGAIPVNKQHGYPNGRYFGGSAWSDAFKIRQTKGGSVSTDYPEQKTSIREHTWVDSNNFGGVSLGDIFVVNAIYGERGVFNNVTSQVRGLMSRGRFLVNNRDMGGDPIRGVVKYLEITWRRTGSYSSITKPKVYVTRTDVNHGWGQRLILPMFSTQNGNAERGIEYMKTDEGIRNMRNQMEYMTSSDGSVRIAEHCNFHGWNYYLIVGSHIPDTSRTYLPLNRERDRIRNIDSASSISVPSNVVVTLYTDRNYGGRNAVIRGPKTISCLAGGNLINGTNWNDRIRSMKVESTKSQPYLKINTSGWIAPTNAPIKSMIMTRDGKIMFFSQTFSKTLSDWNKQLTTMLNSNKLVLKWSPPNMSPCYQRSDKYPFNELTPRVECPCILILAGIRGQDPLYNIPFLKEITEVLVPGLNFVRLINGPDPSDTRKNKVLVYPYYKVELNPEQIASVERAPPNEKQWNSSLSFMIMAGFALNAGEYLSTIDGRITAKLSADGTGFEILIDTVDTPCIKDPHGNKTTNDTSSVALYSMSGVGDTNAFGKMGYVDYNGKLHEYKESDIVVEDKFEGQQKRRDIVGYDLPGMPIANIASIEDAKKECLKNNKAFGFVYVPTNKLLYLKDRASTKKVPTINRETILVRRKIKPDPNKFNKGCPSPDDVTYINSTLWRDTPQSNTNMESKICDRNRFLNEPAMVELRRDWEEKTKKANEFGGSVQNASSSMLVNRYKQQLEVVKNNKENKLNDNIYNTTMSTKIPTADNNTSGGMKTIPDSFEGFTPLAAERNLQYELNNPDQRAKSTTFRNINGIVKDTKLLVDENYLKMGVWSVAAMVTGLISAKLIMRGNN